MVAGVIRSRQSTNRLGATTASATGIFSGRRQPSVGTASHHSHWIVVAMFAWMVASAGRTVLSFSFKSKSSLRSGATMAASWIRQDNNAQLASTSSFSSGASSFGGSGKFRITTSTRTTTATFVATTKRRPYGVSSLMMMPEGPEVRTLVDQLRGGIGKRLVDIRFLSGRYVAQRPVGFSDFAKTMTPLRKQPQEQESNNNMSIDTILDWNCKGKFIYILLDDGARSLGPPNSNATNDNDGEKEDDDDDFQRSIWITLGMTGRFVNEAKHLDNSSHGRWVLELFDDTTTSANAPDTDTDVPDPKTVHNIYYHDKRNFGTVKFCLSRAELEKKLKLLGPDVLAMARFQARVDNPDDPSAVTIDDELEAKEADAASIQEFLQLLEKQRNKQLNVCKFLMNQQKIAGVGNYILSEALYRSSIDPFCGIDELSTSRRIKLFREIQAVSLESYRSQQALSPTLGTGYTPVRGLEAFEFELQVYGNLDKCPKGNKVIRETSGPHGRTIWYTEQQLFVARPIREERERQAQEQADQQKQQKEFQKQQKQGQPSKSKSKSNATTGDPWTIMRRDGVELSGLNQKDTDSVDATNPKEITTNAMSTMDWNLLDGLTDPGWKEALEPYATTSQSFAGLQDFLKEEYSSMGRDQIYPPPHQIFSALNLCPLDKVKVVILGQDPYHGPNQSTGLAFSVSKQIAKIPPSLRNIFKELNDDVGRSSANNGRPPEIRHGDLEGWARQGVLMLNTVLTVRRGQANSHQRKGWEDFTDEIVRLLRDRASSNHSDSDNDSNSNSTDDSGMVFLLWGGPASKKAKSIDDSETKHAIIKTSHPSPLGATKTASPFLTSRCFSRANEALIEMGETPIDWYHR